MPSKALATKDSYPGLLRRTKKEISAGRKAIQHQQALTYWKVGRLISKHLLANKHRAGYGEQLFGRLSKNLQVDKNTLHQSVRFYETYPIVSARLQLDWAHYRKLISVQDPGQRRALERKAAAQKLSSRQLAQEIKERQPKPSIQTIDSDQPIPQLPLQRGRPYTYRLAEPKGIEPKEGNIIVDCGFSVFHRLKLKGKRKPSKGGIVQSVKRQDSYTIEKSAAKPSEIFTYKALLDRVVDGDTVWVNIDCGFDIFIHQKLRLKGIDAPEIATSEGASRPKICGSRPQALFFYHHQNLQARQIRPLSCRRILLGRRSRRNQGCRTGQIFESGVVGEEIGK